jgi:hypothetical protein
MQRLEQVQIPTAEVAGKGSKVPAKTLVVKIRRESDLWAKVLKTTKMKTIVITMAPMTVLKGNEPKLALTVFSLVHISNTMKLITNAANEEDLLQRIESSMPVYQSYYTH